MAAEKKKTVNLGSRNKRLRKSQTVNVKRDSSIQKQTHHSRKEPFFARLLSLRSQEAGHIKVKAMIPMILKAHSMPNRSIRASMVMLMMAPPSPEPENTMPFARPLRRLKYWEGSVDPA